MPEQSASSGRPMMQLLVESSPRGVEAWIAPPRRHDGQLAPGHASLLFGARWWWQKHFSKALLERMWLQPPWKLKLSLP
jgi:hypothetical protein